MQLLHASALVVFWGSAALIVYTYIVYPVLLVALGALRRATAAPRESNDADLPSVSVLVVAHNEESVIRERIDNLLALDYPKDKLELVIASDSSRDRTVDIVNEYGSRGIQLIAFTERTGKSAVLDAVIPRLTGSIAVLSDANTMMEPSARTAAGAMVPESAGRRRLRQAGAHGSRDRDKCGQPVLAVRDAVEALARAGWARCWAQMAASTHIRRSVFQGISHDTIVDDFVIPLLARVRTGCAHHLRRIGDCLRGDAAGNRGRVPAPRADRRGRVSEPGGAYGRCSTRGRAGSR